MNKNTIKPEMTVEAKARFFAQYWGQEVLKASVYTHKVSAVYNLKHESFYLSLKPLSSITDEDYTEVMMKKYPYQPFSSFKRGDMYPESFNQEQVDFLRSRGYALPFVGWSVEEMVEAGWIKLKGGSDA